MFTFFTDRDGKMQLEALAQSGFDPLSRTCRFMLTEEAHHMFVGETGVQRVIERTCQAMKENGIEDPHDIERIRALGVIDLPTIQKKANLHFSLTLDLFGSEVSTNAANAYNSGLKGRYREDKIEDDHRLLDSTYPVLRCVDGVVVQEAVPALSALNMRLRDDYVVDCNAGVGRWNKAIEKAGSSFQLTLPNVAFNRKIGEFNKVPRRSGWPRDRCRHLRASGTSGCRRADDDSTSPGDAATMRREPCRLDRGAEGSASTTSRALRVVKVYQKGASQAPPRPSRDAGRERSRRRR
jgi:benzoyl-CoA oxygenase B subunit